MHLFLLASIGDITSGSGQLVFIFSGFLFVIFVLMILAVITSSISLFFKADGNSVAVISSPGTVLSRKDSEAEPHSKVIIAAAVHMAMDGHPHRVLAIKQTDNRQ